MLEKEAFTKFFLPLNHTSKVRLYEKFPFFELKHILPNETYHFIPEKNISSWLCLLFSNYFTYDFKNSGKNVKGKILRTRVMFITSNYMYLDTAAKYTILKPKFKNFFALKVQHLLQKEILILSYTYFFSFFGFSSLRFLITKFLPYTTIKRYSTDSKAFFKSQLFLRKVVFFLNPLSKHFFFSKLFKYNFSLYQKKINFLQFTIFFKNINYVPFSK
jgi:hypothetical protein